jgi:chemotaxis response regulator CheB
VRVVDDHAVVREVTITESLEDFGATVTAVPEVPEALEPLERERPNVVHWDIAMPGEDGERAHSPKGALCHPIEVGRRRRPPSRGKHPDRSAGALQAGFQDHVASRVDARGDS